MSRIWIETVSNKEKQAKKSTTVKIIQKGSEAERWLQSRNGTKELCLTLILMMKV